MEYKEYTGRTVDDALMSACQDLAATSEEIEYEIVEKGVNRLFKSKPAMIKAKKKNSIEDDIRKFLNDIFEAMGIEVEILIDEDKEANYYQVEFKGKEMGILIGKRGQTLDSLQYLTNLCINKNYDHYIKIKLDTENYRQRRKETLENLAKNIAYKVKRTKKTVSLEPMNPFERRIIHYALQDEKSVVTYSEGEEPYRHVVVTLKRDTRDYYDRRNKYHNRYQKKHEEYESGKEDRMISQTEKESQEE